VIRETAVLQAKDAYSAVAHRAGVLLTAAHLMQPTPPALEHRLRHWSYSLTRVHDPIALAQLDVPWWTYRAIDEVHRWIAAQPRPVKVFEYGSGASTHWLSRRADEVHSVEHHRAFGEAIRSALPNRANVDLQIVEAVPTPWPVIGSAKEGHHGLDFANYVAAIDNVGGEFDLIVIDGRARTACLAQALPRLHRDGIIVFDNSLRRRYRPAIRAAAVVERRLAGLTPTLPYPEQTSLLRRVR
jgi:predicted O-methyltransferase YrrM